MKTRVVRYWHGTQWQYKVEKYIQATGTEKWVYGGGECGPAGAEPKAGQWYWAHVAAPLSLEHAKQAAEDLAKAKNPSLVDVVAEFG